MVDQAPRFAHFEHGGRIGVARPAKPELALKLAKAAVGTNTNLGEIARKCGPYTFIGYLSVDKESENVLDEEGNIVDKLKPGDSFIGKGKLQ